MVEGKEEDISEGFTQAFENVISMLGNIEERVVGRLLSCDTGSNYFIESWHLNNPIHKLRFLYIGFCDKVLEVSAEQELNYTKQNYPKEGYRFLGLVSMTDPPRSSVLEAILQLRAASVKVIMLTGDHPTTAISVARSVGIFSKGMCFQTW